MAWFNKEDVQALADAKSYARGETYLDAVRSVDDVAGGAVAVVQGTDAYVVRLTDDHGKLAGQCSCPYGEEGAFCKHCVAAALTLLFRGAASGAEEPIGSDMAVEDAIRAYLATLASEDLVDMLCEEAQESPRLHRRLSLRASQDTGGTPDVFTMRREVDAALLAPGFLSHQESSDYAAKAADILAVLDELIDAGHAAETRPLAKRALERITSALEDIDDSAGVVGDACQQALSLYAEACAQAPPDPRELASWLVDIDLNGPGWPNVDLGEFEEALGDAGLRAYRERVDELWAQLPPEPGSGTADEHMMSRLMLRHMREQITEIDSDVDTLVAVLAETLPRPDTYERIAGALYEAGRLDEAIRWAEEGCEKNQQHVGGRGRLGEGLLEFLETAYLQADRGDDAVALRRGVFERVPGQHTYDKLALIARRLGVWPELHESALAFLVAKADENSARGEELVRVLLTESDIDAAWDAARAYGCGDETWLRLARRCEESHPKEVAPVYEYLAERRIETARGSKYGDAVQLVLRLRDVHEHTDQPERFPAFLDDLRKRHGRKRSLLAELDRQGLTAPSGTST